MIVRLSHAQWNSIRERIPADVAEFMAEHRVAIRKTHDYSMPAIGWKRALDALIAEMFGPLGGHMGNMTPYRAIGLIAKAVSDMETHPAFTPGLAVMGVRNEIIPAWITRSHGHDEPPRSPYPGEGRRFMLLGPELISRSGHELTIWKMMSLDQAHPADVSLDPAFHLNLWCGVEATC